jgi:hypothetical protein
MNKKKEFEVNGVKYYVITPTPKIIQEGGVIYAVELSNCLKRGVQSKTQILKFLSENGVWDSSKDVEEKRLRKELEELDKLLFQGNKKGARVSLKEGRRIALDIKDTRRKLVSLLSERQSHEANSAESLADNARFDYLVSACTFKEDGAKVYQSLQSYLDNAQDDVAYTAASNLASLMYQVDEDYTKTLPENVWLKNFNLVDDDMRLVDKKGRLVDREGRLINDQGHYLNENSERVDINGLRLDENGNYLIEVEYYDDEDDFPVSVEKEEEVS